jgi:hypothetical protein
MDLVDPEHRQKLHRSRRIEIDENVKINMVSRISQILITTVGDL